MGIFVPTVGIASITSISANCFKIKSLHIVNCQQKIEPFFPHNQLIMASYPVQQIYYDGKPQSAKSGKTFKTVDPSTAKPLADVQTASPADIDSAIASAQAAFPSWSQTPPIVRSRILLKAVSLLRSRNDEIAKVETHDTGKAFSETSTVDVVTGADVLEYFANLVASGGLNGETTQLRPDAWIYTKKEALGVCAGIGAWNYPIQIALWKSAPCLAAGNCMVYKPSEVTPLHGQLHRASVYRSKSRRLSSRRHEIRDDGTRRQKSLHHPPRRRHRERRRRSHDGKLLLHRPSLHKRDTGLRSPLPQIRIREETPRESTIYTLTPAHGPEQQFRTISLGSPLQEGPELHPARYRCR